MSTLDKVCNVRKLCDDLNCDECWERSFASSEYKFCWSLNNVNLTPRDIFKYTAKPYLFICDYCDHEFSMKPCSIKIGNWCPFCANPQTKLCENENCIRCWSKSFASTDYIYCWSEKNKLKPHQVFKHSHTKYFFNCDYCKHEFKLSLDDVMKGSWCQFCSNPPKLLCEEENCMICFNKSFVPDERAKYWSNKNKLSPRQVFASSNKKFLFDCPNCLHEITCSPSKDRWCIYCSHKKLCDDNNCEFCFKNSFASHILVKQWSKQNKLSPRQVFIKSNKKYFLTCDVCCKDFQAKLESISRGQWCPFCYVKTEKILLKWLSENYHVEYQKKFEWCKNVETNRHFIYDFYLPDFDILIELDGGQHFFQVWNWKSPEDNVIIDIYKMKQANKNEKTVIRLLQDNVINNKIDWKTYLIEYIKKYDKPSRIFICKNNEYVNHYKKN